MSKAKRRKEEQELFEVTDKLAAKMTALAIMEETKLKVGEQLQILKAVTTWIGVKNRVADAEDEESQLERFRASIKVAGSLGAGDSAGAAAGGEAGKDAGQPDLEEIRAMVRNAGRDVRSDRADSRGAAHAAARARGGNGARGADRG